MPQTPSHWMIENLFHQGNKTKSFKELFLIVVRSSTWIWPVLDCISCWRVGNEIKNAEVAEWSVEPYMLLTCKRLKQIRYSDADDFTGHLNNVHYALFSPKDTLLKQVMLANVIMQWQVQKWILFLNCCTSWLSSHYISKFSAKIPQVLCIPDQWKTALITYLYFMLIIKITFYKWTCSQIGVFEHLTFLIVPSYLKHHSIKLQRLIFQKSLWNTAVNLISLYCCHLKKLKNRFQITNVLRCSCEESEVHNMYSVVFNIQLSSHFIWYTLLVC